MGNGKSKEEFQFRLGDGSLGTFSPEEEDPLFYGKYTWNGYTVDLPFSVKGIETKVPHLWELLKKVGGYDSLKIVEDFSWNYLNGPSFAFVACEELLREWKRNVFQDHGTLVHPIMDPDILFSVVTDDETFHVVQPWGDPSKLVTLLEEKGRNYLLCHSDVSFTFRFVRTSFRAVGNIKRYFEFLKKDSYPHAERIRAIELQL